MQNQNKWEIMKPHLDKHTSKTRPINNYYLLYYIAVNTCTEYTTVYITW
jgi:hypothetical protein